MANLTGTQLTLRASPTAGVTGEHSPYYRRLFSAGYKGYVQGAVGGITLYGSIGTAMGAIIGVPLLAATAASSFPLLPLLLIPGLGMAFGLYGAHTFADIGKTAAVIAENAEINEKRRDLKDSYRALPDSPEYDDEAKAIIEILQKDDMPREPERLVHWRPALIGAALGITVALIIVATAPYFAPHLLGEVISFLGTGVGAHGAAAAATGVAAHGAAAAAGHSAVALGLSAGLIGLAGAAIGGLSGALIGLDREYIRRWMDGAEIVVHDKSKTEAQLQERVQDIERLGDARTKATLLASNSPERANASMKIQVAEAPRVSRAVDESHPHGTTQRETPIDPRQISALSEITHEGRVSAEQAMARPVL